MLTVSEVAVQSHTLPHPSKVQKVLLIRSTQHLILSNFSILNGEMGEGGIPCVLGVYFPDH